MKKIKKFVPGRSYSKKDWDEVSDNPELSDAQLKQGRPFAEVFPDLAASIKRARGRPRIEKPKQAVTLRVNQDTLNRFKARGEDWRAQCPGRWMPAAGAGRLEAFLFLKTTVHRGSANSLSRLRGRVGVGDNHTPPPVRLRRPTSPASGRG